MLKVHEENTPI